MATELIINASLPETRIALMENGEIQDLVIERASGKGIVGNIYKGRVTRVLPGMQAAFVDIGLEKAAFLYVDDVYTHPEIWEEEEGTQQPSALSEISGAAATEAQAEPSSEAAGETPVEPTTQSASESREATPAETTASDEQFSQEPELPSSDDVEFEDEELEEDEEVDGDDDEGPVGMGPGPDDSGNAGDSDDKGSGSSAGDDQPGNTVAPGESVQTQGSSNDPVSAGQGQPSGRRRRSRRGRRGGKFRRREREGAPAATAESYPESYQEQVLDEGVVGSDRSALAAEGFAEAPAGVEGERPTAAPQEGVVQPAARREGRPSQFRAQRSSDRRVPPKATTKPSRGQVNIQDLLKEGQEVIVQVAKDPIATKGARLTCHISLPGRHLVCMPTIDHVGVSRRIERDDERRKLRDFVERNRPKNLGFIVRTASGRGQAEKRIKQDIDYLTRLWTEIREKAGEVTAPALVYEDLNPVLRAIRDWVTEDIDKIVVDSRYHYNEIQRFVAHFMPSLRQKIELYHGDIPVFDAYNISTELSRALERKVWLKSGGYLVIDQAEALVAIDVNTGRYVGKKNLEDTILKTNLEAVQEIAYQLRLRNCGGIIILDLIDMEKEENKQRVYRALEDALKRDRARPSILKISELGLVEMTRKRTRDTMVRTLCESCSSCEGKGFVKGKQTVAYEILRELEREGIERDVSKILVQAHPDVIDILAIDERETLDHMERRYRKQIYLQAVMDFHQEQFEVMADKQPGAEREKDRDRDRERGGRDRDHRDRGGRDRGRDRDRGRHRRSEQHQRREEHPSQGQPHAPARIIPAAQTPSGVEGQAPPTVAGEPGGSAQPRTASPGSDDHFDEEDRLAFLRAQAAQDAALAQLRSSGQPGISRGGEKREGGREGGRDGGRGRRGRRRRSGGGGGSGKFRQGGDRPDRKQFGPNAQSETPRSSGNDDPGPSDGGGGGGGAGGDHSTPPV